MDACKVELLEVETLLHKATPSKDGARPPLVPSENNKNVVSTRKPQTREVVSRYKSGVSSAPSSRPTTPSSAPTTPKRFESHTAERIKSVPGDVQPKRVVSTEKRRLKTPSERLTTSSNSSSRTSTPSPRASTPSPFSRSASTSRSTTPVRDTLVETRNSARRLPISNIPDGLWPSMRNLSSSFQSSSGTTAVSRKEKLVVDLSRQASKASVNGIAERKRSPLRGSKNSDPSENSKPHENSNMKIIDHHRWPAMLGGRLSGNALSRSVDLTDKAKISSLSSRGVLPRGITSNGRAKSIQESLTEVARRLSLDGNVSVETNIKSEVSSFQSSKTSAAAARPTKPQSVRVEHDAKISTVNTSHILERPSTASQSSRVRALSTSSITRPSSPTPKLSRPSSPAKSLTRPSSPIKSSSTTPSISSRGLLSPSRTRPSTPSSPSSNTSNHLGGVTSSICNFIADLRKGKNSNNVDDCHQLRLLHNVYLQWRFVNAQADDTMMIQKTSTENALYGMWTTISNLFESVIMKRIDLQQLQQDMELNRILSEHLEYLECWSALEREHYSSLSEVTDALKATTFLLPVIGGAKADTFAVKGAVSSAVDIMQAMGSSVCFLISKIEGRRSLVSELAAVVAKEKAMLEECRELLGLTASMQVQESSLITHILQLTQSNWI